MMNTPTTILDDELIVMYHRLLHDISVRCRRVLESIWCSDECPKAWLDDFDDGWLDIIDAHAFALADAWLTEHHVTGPALAALRKWILDNAHNIIVREQEMAR